MIIAIIFLSSSALIIWGLSRLIYFQDHQRFNKMMIGEFRCSWRESGFTYARVTIEVWNGWRWRAVWNGGLGRSSCSFEHILPDRLREIYNDEICAYIRWRDAWERENATLAGSAKSCGSKEVTLV